MGGHPEVVFPIFVGVWIVLGLLSVVIFFLNKDSAIKRRVHPPFAIAVGVLFLIFAALMGFARESFYYLVLIPAVVLITIVNLRNTRFCDSCGKMVQHPFIRRKFCSKCGAKLESKEV